MSKSKSLGSSPIGFQSDNSTLSFIPDLGVSSKQERSSDPDENWQDEDQTKKKVVSYYLEESLISELKQTAEEHGIYYSTLISRAVKEWLQKNAHNHANKVKQHPFLME